MKMPEYIVWTDELKQEGIDAVVDAQKGGCQSFYVLCQVFTEAVYQRFYNQLEENENENTKSLQ